MGRAQIVIPNGPRLGSKVIEVNGLKKAMGDKLLIEGLDFSLPPGGIVGVIGPNGAGKSTLFKMLTGQETPDAGTVEYGDTVKLSYVDQSRDDLKDGDNVWEAISGGARSSSWAMPRSIPAPIARRSTSRVAINRRKSRSCPGASATASTWPAS